jgi:hypothetical protein
MEDRLSDILKQYDVQFLRPQFGESKVRDALYEGLVAIMKKSEQAQASSLLNPINYEEIAQEYSPVRVNALRRAFGELNIFTYQDLARYLDDRNRRLKTNLTDYQFQSVINPFWFKGVGELTTKALLAHLKKRGFPLSEKPHH